MIEDVLKFLVITGLLFILQMRCYCLSQMIIQKDAVISRLQDRVKMMSED